MTYLHIGAGIVLSIAVVLLIWSSYQILLAFFAGLLFAIFLHRIARLIHRWLPIPQQVAVLLVLALLLLLTAGVSALFASTVMGQVVELAQRLPAAWEKLNSLAEQVETYRQLVPNLNAQASQALARSSSTIFSRVTSTVSNFTSIVVAVGVAFVMGIYGALEPQYYLRGFLAFFPAPRQEQVRYILRQLEATLWQWLVGRLVTMFVIGTLTTLALTLFDIPLAMILGLLAGILAIIPYLGAILSAVPALLIGFSESPRTALTILIIFIGVQIVEGNLITPMIERRIVRLPPALTIGVQLLLGGIAGVFGIMLASPLTAAAAAVVKSLLARHAVTTAEGSKEG
jgi:predicted PurR-regulated permease PerM